MTAEGEGKRWRAGCNGAGGRWGLPGLFINRHVCWLLGDGGAFIAPRRAGLALLPVFHSRARRHDSARKRAPEFHQGTSQGDEFDFESNPLSERGKRAGERT